VRNLGRGDLKGEPVGAWIAGTPHTDELKISSRDDWVRGEVGARKFSDRWLGQRGERELGAKWREVGGGERLQEQGKGAVYGEAGREVERVLESVRQGGESAERVTERFAGGLVAVPTGEGEWPVPVGTGDAERGALGEKVPGFFGRRKINGGGAGGGEGVNADEIRAKVGKLVFELTAPHGGRGSQRHGANIKAADDNEASRIVDRGGAQGVFEQNAGTPGMFVALAGETKVADTAVLRGGGHCGLTAVSADEPGQRK
jgi:hypothetical protein